MLASVGFWKWRMGFEQHSLYSNRVCSVLEIIAVSWESSVAFRTSLTVFRNSVVAVRNSLVHFENRWWHFENHRWNFWNCCSCCEYYTFCSIYFVDAPSAQQYYSGGRQCCTLNRPNIANIVRQRYLTISQYNILFNHSANQFPMTQSVLQYRALYLKVMQWWCNLLKHHTNYSTSLCIIIRWCELFCRDTNILASMQVVA